jgi:thiosulfate/3-mercaptopyruvate sulfurtransferase
MQPSAEAFAAAMRRFGVGNGTQVVLYSTTTPQWATRVWWLFRVFGFDNAAVLDGGFQKWSREGRLVEAGSVTPRPPGNFVVRKERPLMVGKEEVLRAVGDGAVCTLNALSAEQHAGSGGNSYGRLGRIKGSVNLPAAHLIDPATNAFLPAGELRRRFDRIDAFDREIITYCGGGIAASADAFALVMLGHPNVRLYDASMSEWANDPSLPMETG